MVVQCQQCRASYGTEKLINGEICPECDNPYAIKNYRTAASMPPPQVNKYITSIQAQLVENPQDKQLNSSLGICFLKLKLYDKALPFFDKAMEDNFSDPIPYFYASVCLLKGKKAFVALRPEIDKIIGYLDAAISLDPQAEFYYFQAYIKNDYFERKFLDSKPGSKELLQTAVQNGYTENNAVAFYELLGVERPQGL